MLEANVVRKDSNKSRYFKLADKYYFERFDMPDSVEEWERYYALMDFARFLGYEFFGDTVTEEQLHNYIKKAPHLSTQWFCEYCSICAGFIRYFWQ